MQRCKLGRMYLSLYKAGFSDDILANKFPLENDTSVKEKEKKKDTEYVRTVAQRFQESKRVHE